MDNLYELKQINQNTFKGKFSDFTCCQDLIIDGVGFINYVLSCRVTNIFLDLNNYNIEFVTEKWKQKSMGEFVREIDYWNRGREMKFFFTFLEKRVVATYQKTLTAKQTFNVLNENGIPQEPDFEKKMERSDSDWKRMSVDVL